MHVYHNTLEFLSGGTYICVRVLSDIIWKVNISPGNIGLRLS